MYIFSKSAVFLTLKKKVLQLNEIPNFEDVENLTFFLVYFYFYFLFCFLSIKL